jgi:hypothetical protein
LPGLYPVNGKGTTVGCFDREGRLLATLAPGDSSPSVFGYDPAGNQLTASHTGASDDTQGDDGSVYNEDGNLLRAAATPTTGRRASPTRRAVAALHRFGR